MTLSWMIQCNVFVASSRVDGKFNLKFFNSQSDFLLPMESRGRPLWNTVSAVARVPETISHIHSPQKEENFNCFPRLMPPAEERVKNRGGDFIIISVKPLES